MNQNSVIVYEAIDRLCLENGYAPTMRELAEETGLAVATVHWHVRELIRKGHLTMKPGSPRTLKCV